MWKKEYSHLMCDWNWMEASHRKIGNLINLRFSIAVIVFDSFVAALKKFNKKQQQQPLTSHYRKVMQILKIPL